MRQRRATWAALLCLAVFACLPNTRAQERLLVGAYVDHDPVATVEVLREGDEFLIPLESFAEITGCRIEGEAGLLQLRTPLGSVELAEGDVRTIDGVDYVSRSFVERTLASSITFDEGEYALDFSVPWQPGASLERGPRSEPRADVGPPGLTLSTVREDLLYTRYGEYNRWTSSTTLGGALSGGNWRVRYEDDFEGNSRMRDYAWYRVHGRSLFLAGRQTLQVHPLLNTFELTGVQTAWTNQPLDIFPQSFEARELLPRRVQPAATFRGPAPPGSLVKLRLDGIVVDQQIVGLSGAYEFLEVRLPARQLSQIEVLVFDRRTPFTPVEIHEKTITASEFLLREGAVVHVGGAGRAGNLLDDRTRANTTDDQAAGFYQWRHGLTGRLTVEAAIQHADYLQGLSGFTAMLARGWVMSLGVGASNGTLGYNLDMDGRGTHWRFLASSRVTPAGFVSTGTRDRSDHSAEGWYSANPRLDIGLVGRVRTTVPDTDEYILPAIYWRPVQRFVFRARPNFDGEYYLYSSYQPTFRDRIIATSEGRTVVDYSHAFNRKYTLAAGSAFGGGLADRYSTILTVQAGLGPSGSWSVGALNSDGHSGVLLGAVQPVLPGVLARVHYESVPFSGYVGSGDQGRLTFGLTVDLAFAGRRVQPADAYAVRADRGAIAGRVRIDREGGPMRVDLANLAIRVDGRAVAKTDKSGNFFVGSLREGVYLVELDTENLPLELVPKVSTLAVKVVPGAATRVDLIVRPEYGLAGRVVDLRGRPLPGVSVELLNADRQVVARAVADQFGLFRMDGIAVGQYVLRVAPGSFASDGAEMPTLPVEVVDEFLFNQDLELPVDRGPEPAPRAVKDPTSA